jgi:curved DNA-binding protein CbpA
MSTSKEIEARRIVALASMSLYSVLGVNFDASDGDIKLAYRKLALRFHPDKNNSTVTPSAERAFKAISLANACLSDTEYRERYDMFGRVDDEQQVTDFSRADLSKFTAVLKDTKLKELLQLYLVELEHEANAAVKAEQAALEEQRPVTEEDKEKDSQLGGAREISAVRKQLVPEGDFSGATLILLTAALFGIFFYTSAMHD